MISIRLSICVFGIALVSLASWGQDGTPAGANPHSVGICGVIERSDSPCVLLDDRRAGPVTGYVALKEGTIVELRLTKKMRARDLQSHTFGQRVELEVESDVVIDDQVVIAARTEAWGSIMDSSKAPGRFFEPGSLRVAVEGTRAITGDLVRLSGSFEIAGEPFSCGDQNCALVYVLLGPLMKGNDAVASKGTSILARVTASLTFDRASIATTPLVRRVSDELQHARDRGRGLVVVYRREDDGCRATSSTPERPVWCGKVDLAVDDTAAVGVSAGHALQFEIDPGEHRLRSPNSEGMTISVSAGAIQYVRLHLSSWKRHAQMAIVDADVGEPESYPLESTLIVDRVKSLALGHWFHFPE